MNILRKAILLTAIPAVIFSVQFFKFGPEVELTSPPVLAERPAEPSAWIIDQNFDGSTSLPTGWTTIDGDADGRGWYIYTASPHSSPNSAASYYNAAGNNDWLITPQFLCGTGYIISFWYASQDADYLETVEVRVSTTTPTQAAFTNIIHTRVDVPNAWTYQEVSLASYAGSNIYIAFRNISVDEFILKVDDVRIGSPLAHDVGITGSTASTVIEPPTSWTPQCNVYNYGSNTESFNVSCVIMQGTTTVYNQTTSVSSLASSTSRSVTFPAHSGFTANKIYTATYTAILASDENTSNNTLEQTLSTFGPRKVLIQEFTSIGCPYCPRAAEGLHTLDGTVGDGAIMAAYHSTTSFGADPFYFAAAANIASYYSVGSYPDVWFAGLTHLAGGFPSPGYGYTNYLAEYNAARAVQTPYQIGVHIDATSSTGCTFTTTVTRTGTLPGGATPKLRYAVVENNIPYSWGSSPAQTLIRDCVRDLIVGSAGVTLTGGAVETDVRSITFSPSWNTANTYVVAYVQNDATKEVWNAAKVPVTVLGLEEDADLPREVTISAFPNPFNSAVRIEISGRPDDVKVFDITGKICAQIPRNETGSYIWQPDETASSGIYFVRAVSHKQAISKQVLYIK